MRIATRGVFHGHKHRGDVIIFFNYVIDISTAAAAAELSRRFSAADIATGETRDDSTEDSTEG